MINNNLEILAPAGSVTSLQASLKAGADAVYIGGRLFGARAYADNLGEDELIDAIKYVHKRGKKLYLTVNTLIKDQEFDALYSYLKPLYESGLDAVIIQDLGVLDFLEKSFPALPAHISTQMSITTPEAKSALNKNVTRIVPARELTIDEIRHLKQATGLELEVFCHGALCYSYSGQCLFSAACGDRSGNRGRCAQPCRKKYSLYRSGNILGDGYLLSPKDIYTIDRLPDLIDAGVDSLKIEGRMKSPEYAAKVSKVYREAADFYFENGREAYDERLKGAFVKNEKTDLLDLFNRGGFSSGYAFVSHGPEMMSIKRPNHSGVLVGTAKIKNEYAYLKVAEKLYPGDVLEIRSDIRKDWFSYTTKESVKPGEEISFKAFPGKKLNKDISVPVFRIRRQALLDSIDNEYINTKDNIPVRISCDFYAGCEAVMSAECEVELDGRYVTVSGVALGNIVDFAKSSPTSNADIEEKIRRSGDSEYSISEVLINTSGDIFMPKSVIGNLRRECLINLSENIDALFIRDELPRYEENSECKSTPLCGVSILVRTSEQLLAIRDYGGKNIRLIIEWDSEALGYFRKNAEELRESFSEIYIRSPRIANEGNIGAFTVLEEDYGKYYDGVYIRSLSFISLTKKKLFADDNLYCVNFFAAKRLKELGFSGYSHSKELTKKEHGFREKTAFMADELTVYERAEIMYSKQCLKRTLGYCNHTEELLGLKDERDNEYYVYSECACAGKCFNVIYDCELTVLEDYVSYGVNSLTENKDYSRYRYSFLDENRKEVLSVLSGTIPKNTIKSGHFYSPVM